MTKEERTENIERYLRKELSGAEQTTFEIQLQQDGRLRRELRIHRELHESIGDPELQQFSELIRESETDYFVDQDQRQIRRFRNYRTLAAAVTLLLMIGFGYWYVQRPAAPEALFAAYYEPYQAPGTFRGEDPTDLEDNFLLGLARYDEGQYAEAAEYFSRTLAKDTGKDLAIFLRGLSYLETNAPDLAEQDLQKVIANEDSLFRESARWYLGLLYLKLGDTQRAQRTFEDMEDSARVEDILKEMR